MRTHRKLFLIAVVCLALSPAHCPADTYVGGMISADTHWTQAGGPYIVTSSIGVIGGATLTIDPGVDVRFEPDKALVVDTGSLVARGTQASPIRFTANQGSANRWAYIQFSDGAADATFDAGGNYVSGSILEHTVVEYAGSTPTQGAVRAISSSPFIHASTVRDNSYSGIYAKYAEPIRLTGNTITGNTGSSYHGGGVCMFYSGGAALTGNTITSNTSSRGGGVSMEQSYSMTLSGNTISGNTASSYGGGVYMENAKWAALMGNTISGNTSSSTGGGVYMFGSDSVALTDNTISENTGGDGGGIGVAYDCDNTTLQGDRIINNHSDSGVGGIFVATGSDGWDLTGPDEPFDIQSSVQIYGNDGYQFYNGNAFGGSFGYDDPGNVDARYVWWGTTDEAQIAAGIYDFFDDAGKGIVFYSPYTVPEPATLSLLALGWLALLRRRRSP